MKKNLAKILRKKELLIVLSIIISAIILVVVAPALLLKFQNWQTLAEKNRQETERLETFTENVSLLAEVDQQTIEDYKELMGLLVPAEQDRARAVALIDVLAKSNNLSIESLKAGSSTSTTSTPTGVGTATPGAVGGTETEESPAQQNTNTTATPTQNQDSSASAEYNISLTFKGTFPATLDVIEALETVKRALSVKDVSISKEEGVSILNVTLNFVLPVAQGHEVTVEDRLELSASEEEKLNEVLTKLKIDVSPTTSPTGRTNPFN